MMVCYPTWKTLGFCLGVLSAICAVSAGSISIIGVTDLGPDPQTVNWLNGESFQQDPLVTFNGYQYAVFWVADTTNTSIRHASISRRSLDPTPATIWETFTFTDYNQTEDDGHDVITLGISHTDGTIHLSFDQHDNPFNYRISQPGVANNPSTTPWSPTLFGPILNYLPGLESLDPQTYFINITYPRFLSFPPTSVPSNEADLVLEMRVGRSGLGDDWLYKYVPWSGWELVGRYLEGVNNNAYINGIDFDYKGNLQVTWTYRDYVNDIGQNVAVEAGPNGPENNHDVDYASSPDLGQTWYNTWGQLISNTSLAAQAPILPTSAGITVLSIPKYGGILNQEAQTVDAEGRVHVLNRENGTGIEQWFHYWRSPIGTWTRTPFPLTITPPSINNVTNTPTVIGKRGKFVALPATPSPSPSPAGGTTLLAILPSNAPNSTALSILSSTSAASFGDWKVVWEVESGCGWEPLFDRYRLEEDGVLSLYLVNGTRVVVTDLELSGF
ncbi:hypothetical protein JAAARDRAFT_34765 [Jaapia argillacea MUCL 33604]|uniref:Uncharacterized protein n=1 Tax=Jaapia argillacea MUCL 33604 TaxID=933084 RepID=A0A067PVS5_9AGAM|nr:hypothetical protein JAAARDRAFT_34765 [Jaapia argillacea MUCL 33604]